MYTRNSKFSTQNRLLSYYLTVRSARNGKRSRPLTVGLIYMDSRLDRLQATCKCQHGFPDRYHVWHYYYVSTGWWSWLESKKCTEYTCRFYLFELSEALKPCACSAHTIWLPPFMLSTALDTGICMCLCSYRTPLPCTTEFIRYIAQASCYPAILPSFVYSALHSCGQLQVKLHPSF